MKNDSEQDLSVYEDLLLQAQRELTDGAYADAESSARMALDGFSILKDEPTLCERAYLGIQETGRVMTEARRLWKASSIRPSIQEVDELRRSLAKEIDEVDKDLRRAAHKAVGDLGDMHISVER
jgi:hypothetical protein